MSYNTSEMDLVFVVELTIFGTGDHRPSVAEIITETRALFEAVGEEPGMSGGYRAWDLIWTRPDEGAAKALRKRVHEVALEHFKDFETSTTREETKNHGRTSRIIEFACSCGDNLAHA